MREQELFLLADRALRDVFSRLSRDDLDRAAPPAWTRRTENPTLRDVLAAHAYDEAWVPDALAGRTMDEVGDAHDGDLLGEDPIASYQAINDAATAAVSGELDPRGTVHVTYGEIPVAEYLTHIGSYRAFQAALIARLAGLDYALPERLVDLLMELVVPRVEEWRAIGIFGPEQPAPEGADRETAMLAAMGFPVR